MQDGCCYRIHVHHIRYLSDSKKKLQWEPSKIQADPDSLCTLRQRSDHNVLLVLTAQVGYLCRRLEIDTEEIDESKKKNHTLPAFIHQPGQGNTVSSCQDLAVT